MSQFKNSYKGDNSILLFKEDFLITFLRVIIKQVSMNSTANGNYLEVRFTVNVTDCSQLFKGWP